MEPRLKLWIEHDGHMALSDYRVQLLQFVQETGSLARAASRMRLSYRRAWGKIKELEETLARPLITSEVGGAGGGHSRLTPDGARLVESYRAFRDRMDEALTRGYADLLRDLLEPAEAPAAAGGLPGGAPGDTMQMAHKPV
ncbi:MAG: LysR family transcriptional regulator [Dehalococcoidia bacterium]